tara:strand:+ start:501 stop:2777 length:2277 start_codon:yes stop_codon:yes gene_type:complete
MALNFLTGLDVQGNIDLNKKELQNAVIQNLATDPSVGSSIVGQIIFNTTDDTLKQFVDDADGAGNPGWIEVGTTSGVETVDTTDGTYINLTPNTATTGDVTITADLSAVNGTSVAGTRFLSKDNTWDVPSFTAPGNGILTVQGSGVLGGTGTFSANQSGNTTISVTHDNVSRTDTASSVTNNTFSVIDSVSQSAQGHVTAVNLKTVTVPDNNDDTTYELFGVGSTNGTAGIQLDGNDGTLDNVLIVGAGTSSVVRTANTLTVTSNDQYDGTVTSVIAGTGMTQSGTSTVNPTLNVIGGTGITANANNIDVNSTVVRTSGNQTIAGTKTFTSNVVIPVTPTINAHAASKQYVDQSNVGQSIFQGGYNAATNTPDLDTSPSTAIKNGWFWAVTDVGDFFSEEVQPGDLIYANQDNPGATFSNWTVVQSGQDIAGQGASDGATTKGIAGFNSAHFNVTANGFVSSDIYGGGSSLGIVPSGGAAGKYLNGAGAWAIPTGTYVLPEATSTVRGGIELFSNTDQSVAANSVSSTASRTYGSQLNSAGQLVVNVPWTDTITTYNMMTATVLGLGKLEDNTVQSVVANSVSATGGRTYGIQRNSSNQLVVNVPWTDSTPVDSVDASTQNDLLGINVSPTTGNVKVGLNISSLTSLTALQSADALAIYDDSASTNKKVSVANLSTAVIEQTTFTNLNPVGTSYTITAATHGLGTNANRIMVELIEESTGATVYTDVTRSKTTGLITFTFASSQTAGKYRALLTKVSA